MKLEIFSISKLRIVDSNQLINNLTAEQIKVANDKYNLGNINDFNITVEYKNGMYNIIDNADIYYMYKNLELKNINVGIEVNQISKIVDNLKQRAKKEILNPMLSALIFQELNEIGKLSQRDIAIEIGKSQGAISNKLRLLKLPFQVQAEIIRGTIKERHGRALLQLQATKDYEVVAVGILNKIIQNDLKVVETEDEVYAVLGKKVGIRDALNIKVIKGRNDLKNPSIGAVIEKVDGEIENTMEIINKFFPNLEIELNHGINKEDYVFLLKLKGINK
jgi:ParB/RepB/Spo0J family partition protein